MSTSATMSNKAITKPAKQSKIIILQIDPTLLKRFATSSQPKPSKAKPTLDSPSAATPPPKQNHATPLKDEISPVATPHVDPEVPEVSELAPPSTGLKRKGGPGSRSSGVKAGTPAGDVPKQIRRPGPKKRTKLDGDAPNGTPRPWTAIPQSGHKLGPKANQGAINAGLRALDRTGKPCRKWTKKTLMLKSFTGVQWVMPSWRTPKHLNLNGDTSSDTPNSDDNKLGLANSAGGSERSNAGGDLSVHAAMDNLPSSPVEAGAATPLPS